ncbi:hypothetical protein [Cupriavidus sp. CuC1]|uniref:hypothetical protein n=1 Tax=Cupriavidus sp. CuC1 TaxID=3373131 RepID=UPI0037D7493C
MHLGKSYKISEFTVWSRRQLYASLACGSLPVILYQFLGLKWLSIPGSRRPQGNSIIQNAGSPVLYMNSPQFQAYWDKVAGKFATAVRKIGKVE